MVRKSAALFFFMSTIFVLLPGLSIPVSASSVVVVNPGVIFYLPSSPANLSFATMQTVTSLAVSPTNLSLGPMAFGIQKIPSTFPSLNVSIFSVSPTATVTDVLIWVVDVPAATTVVFSFSGLPSFRYLVGVDNSSQGTYSGPALSFVWALSGVHYFELVGSNPPTFDTTALIFIMFLILVFGLGLAGFAFDFPVLTIFGGIAGFIFSWWFFTQTNQVPLFFILAGVGTLFFLVGILQALTFDGGSG